MLRIALPLDAAEPPVAMRAEAAVGAGISSIVILNAPLPRSTRPVKSGEVTDGRDMLGGRSCAL